MDDIESLIKTSDQLIKDSLLSVEQAREILIKRYGKRSRYLLDANEWADWLRYLRFEKNQIRLLPSCREYELLALVEAEYIRLGWTVVEQKTQFLRQTKHFAERSLSPQELKLWVEHLRSLPINKKDDYLDRRVNPSIKKGV